MLLSTGFSGLTLPYFSRQLIAREVDLERIRRAAPKGSDTDATKQLQQQQKYAAPAAKKRQAKDASPRLPNHLQTLKPKQITEYNGSNAPKQQVHISVALPPFPLFCIHHPLAFPHQFACLAFT